MYACISKSMFKFVIYTHTHPIPMTITISHCTMCHAQNMVSPWAGWPPSSWVMQFAQGPLAKVSRSVCPSPCVCHCHCRVVVTALLVLSMSSSHVLLAGRTVFCHGLLRPDCLGLSFTYLRCAHDSSDVVTMKLFMMQWLSAVAVSTL